VDAVTSAGGSERPPGLTVSQTQVAWGRVRSDRVVGQTIAVSSPGEDAAPWRLASYPWWLAVHRIGNELTLHVRNCGRYRGRLLLRSSAGARLIDVSTRVDPSLARAMDGAGRGFAGQVAVLAIVAWFLGTDPGQLQNNPTLWVIGFAPWICAAGAVWGAIIGGRRLAARSALGAVAAIAVTGILIMCLVALLSWPPFEASWRLPGAILAASAGLCAVAGLAWGAVVGGRWLAVCSALAGAVSGALAVAMTFGLGPIFRPWSSLAYSRPGAIMFLGLTLSPVTAVVIWSTIMGILVAPCRVRR
jgi:hypothetical protein